MLIQTNCPVAGPGTTVVRCRPYLLRPWKRELRCSGCGARVLTASHAYVVRASPN